MMDGSSVSTTVTAIKSVKQTILSSSDILSLMEDFRLMVNDCIRIGLEGEGEGDIITSMRKLSLAFYHHLVVYDLPTCYRLTAISKAAGILRNYRREKAKNSHTKRPRADKLVLTDCYGFGIIGRLLRLPYRKGEYIFIVLNDHALKILSSDDYTRRSITLTPESPSISYSKEVARITPQGAMGIDRNLDNITTADTNGDIKRYGSLARATRVTKKIRQTKRAFTRNDARIRKRIYDKYGKLQRDRVGYLLNECPPG